MNSYLPGIIKLFHYYKNLADKSVAQLDEEQLFWQYNAESNSIAIIMNHMAGNMRSRFTDFLTSDGEKPWRQRDEEFNASFTDYAAVISNWNSGWNCLFNTLNILTPGDLENIVYIRNEGHTVVEAINRQLAHYASHVGQIIFIAKMLKNEEWQSLSIPRNKSDEFNSQKFTQEKAKKHFTDGL